jgi:hypothetical protein
MALNTISEQWRTPRIRSAMFGPLRWRPVTRLFGPRGAMFGVARGFIEVQWSKGVHFSCKPRTGRGGNRKPRRCRVVDRMGQHSRPPRKNLENGNPVHELSRDTEPGLLAGGAEPSVSATVTEDHCFPGWGMWYLSGDITFHESTGLWFLQSIPRPERLLRWDFQRPGSLKSSADSPDPN